MIALSTGMLLVFLLAAGITAVAVLSVFANVIDHETQLHDLRNRVRELHYQNILRSAKLSGHIPAQEEGEIEILDDEGEPIEEGLAIEMGEEAIEVPEAQAA